MRLKQTDYSIRKKQAIWDGSRDGQGLPNALRLINASTQTVQLFADSSIPFKGSIAKNNNSDWRFEIDTSRTCDLADSQTTYFVMLRWDGNNYALEATKVQPIYSLYQPANPATTANGLNCWFDLHNYRMKSWDGSAWVPDRLVFVGEVVTANPGIFSVVNYAFNRRYISPWVYCATGVTAPFAHLLGVPISSAFVSTDIFFSPTASDNDASRVPSMFETGNYFFGAVAGNISRLTFSLTGGTYWAMMSNPDGSGAAWHTTGYVKLILDCLW